MSNTWDRQGAPINFQNRCNYTRTGNIQNAVMLVFERSFICSWNLNSALFKSKWFIFNMHWNVVVKFLLPKSIWSEDWTLILLRFMQNCLINLWNVETSVWRGRIIPFTDFLMIYLFSGLECFQDLTRILNNDIPCARQKQLRKFVSLWLLIANWLFEYSPMK